MRRSTIAGFALSGATRQGQHGARPASARVCSLTRTGSARPLRGTPHVAIPSNATEPRRLALDMVILRRPLARTTEQADEPSGTAHRICRLLGGIEISVAAYGEP